MIVSTKACCEEREFTMLTNLKVDNFKALQDFEIGFSAKLTVLIGGNSVGKSTVLQAIDLLSYVADGRIVDYMNKHNWKVTEMKSKSGHTSFSCIFIIDGKRLVWDFKLATKKDNFICLEEKIIDETSNQMLLTRTSKKTQWFDFEKGTPENFPEIEVNGSVMAFIDETDTNYAKRFPLLVKLKRFLKGIASFELLSPYSMRKTSRNDAEDPGFGGERLAAYLHQLSTEQRREIDETIKKFYPPLQNISTKKKQYGYVELTLNEQYNQQKPNKVPSGYISDGLLRIIAITSLKALGEQYKMLLLDEIEDGINPELAAELVHHLYNVGEKNGKQIIVTTHSPVMLNYFDEKSIVFMWRNVQAKVYSLPMFESETLKNHLTYMNPGEVWLNLSQEEIINALTKDSGGGFM